MKYTKLNQPSNKSFTVYFWIFAAFALLTTYGVALSTLAHM